MSIRFAAQTELRVPLRTSPSGVAHACLQTVVVPLEGGLQTRILVGAP